MQLILPVSIYKYKHPAPEQPDQNIIYLYEHKNRDYE